MNTSPKTIFCDIDGTLLEHHGDIISNYQKEPKLLPNTLENIKQCEKIITLLFKYLHKRMFE
jgi:hydroxymethylpyrimidine pyrophosphatase-like HAD family hydrolase